MSGQHQAVRAAQRPATVCFLDSDHVLDVAAAVLRGPCEASHRAVAQFFEPEVVDPSVLFASGPPCPVRIIGAAGGYGSTVEAPKDTEVLVIRRSRVSTDLMRRLPRLRHVQKLGERRDAVDLDYAERHGISVDFVARPSLESTAEHTVALMLAARRRLLELDRLVRTTPVHSAATGHRTAYNWTAQQGLGRLYRSTVGLIGMGEVAILVASRLRAFGVTILYSSTTELPSEVENAVGARSVSLDELLTRSDVVSLHVPATPGNRHLADDRFFDAMRPGAVFVNVARGELVDEAALRRALDSRRVAAAALDVHACEPRRLDEPLLAYPQVILTPHVAGGLRSEVVTEIGDLLAGIRRALRRDT